jgi:hypothetical protein
MVFPMFGINALPLAATLFVASSLIAAPLAGAIEVVSGTV